ncbi:MAG: GNAT family N-acetyltransferase [Thermoleophilia bacterium]
MRISHHSFGRAAIDAAQPGGLAVSLPERLEPAELEELERYGRESLGEAALDRWQLPVVAAFGFLFVGSLAGETVASAQVIRCRREGDLYMDGLYVRERFRGRGLGGALLQGVLGQLAGQGSFRRLLVTVDPGNAVALALYLPRGFRVVDEMSQFYGPGADRLLLAAALQDGPA